MNKEEQIFDHKKLKELIINTFGRNSFREVARRMDVSRTVVNDWVNGNRKNGPQAASWNKIINLFAERNVHINVSDFYYIPGVDYNHQEAATSFASDELPLLEKELDALRMDNLQLSISLHERNAQITALKNELTKVKAMNKELKAKLRDKNK